MEKSMMRTQNSEYFPHDCDACDDPKIMLMISQLGLEAYGIYWVIVEFLRKQKTYSAPLMLLEPLSRRHGASREKFELIVTKYGLFETENEMFFSPSLKRRMMPLDNKRQHMQQLALKRWNAGAMPAQCEGNAHAYAYAMQSKSKRKSNSKSKEEENIKEFIASLPSPFSSVWQKWIDYKNKIRKPYKTLNGMQSKYSELLSLSGNDPHKADGIVQQSIDNEWSGFFALKHKPAPDLPGEDIFDRERRLLKEAREKINKSA